MSWLTVSDCSRPQFAQTKISYSQSSQTQISYSKSSPRSAASIFLSRSSPPHFSKCDDGGGVVIGRNGYPFARYAQKTCSHHKTGSTKFAMCNDADQWVRVADRIVPTGTSHPAICPLRVISDRGISPENSPLSAVPQKRTKEPRRKPPAAREMGPLSQLKFREFLQTDFKCGG